MSDKCPICGGRGYTLRRDVSEQGDTDVEIKEDCVCVSEPVDFEVLVREYGAGCEANGRYDGCYPEDGEVPRKKLMDAIEKLVAERDQYREAFSKASKQSMELAYENERLRVDARILARALERACQQCPCRSSRTSRSGHTVSTERARAPDRYL